MNDERTKEVLDTIREAAYKQYPNVLAHNGVCLACHQDVDAMEVEQEDILDEGIMCPHCSVDAVIPKEVRMEITPALLALLSDREFGR